MKIICQKSDLLNSVNIALKAVPVKTTMPILESIIIDSIDGCIKLIANDMEMGIETIVKGQIEEEGDIAVNAKTFSEIVRKLPDEDDICIETDDKYQLSISCGELFYKVPGRSSDEFPALPEYQKNEFIELSQFTLRDIIVQTVFSVAMNESNKIMTGELFEVSNGKLRVVALDGHRIALRQIELKESNLEKKVIIPGKALNEISKILSGDAESTVRVYFTTSQAVFEFDDTLVTLRLIDGEYFKVDQMIRADYKIKVVVNKKTLLNSIDRVSPLYKETEKKPIVIDVNGDNFEISLSTSLGNMKQSINVITEGESIKIGFNPKFIMDVLKVVDDEEIFMFMSGPKSPCFIKNTEENYTYLILPVTIG